ncbi:hypothetical protein KJZ67_02525 [Patescibacteria group bacterium]|nr:hypothetical protein [Patescibacteria group bacterium]
MPSYEDEISMRQALAALADAKDPVIKGRLIRRVINRHAAGGCKLADLVDLVFSLEDPRRVSTRTEIASYLKEHPGEWTQKNDDDLRRAIASDRSLPRSIFRDFS